LVPPKTDATALKAIPAKIGPKHRRMTLGNFPALPLGSEARTRLDRAKQQLTEMLAQMGQPIRKSLIKTKKAVAQMGQPPLAAPKLQN
jgi:hypothetical protein